jgi:hypothetical protein
METAPSAEMLPWLAAGATWIKERSREDVADRVSRNP